MVDSVGRMHIPVPCIHMSRNSLQDKYSLRVCCLQSHHILLGEIADIIFAFFARYKRICTFCFQHYFATIDVFLVCLLIFHMFSIFVVFP